MGESSRVERENGGPAGSARAGRTGGTGGRAGAAGTGRPNEQLGLPMSNDPSERLMAALEGRVVGLMERFDEARKRISALENELAARDSQLQASDKQHEVLKQQLRKRLGSIINRISELEERESTQGPEA